MTTSGNRKHVYSLENFLPKEEYQCFGDKEWNKIERHLWRKLIFWVKEVKSKGKKSKKVIHIWRKPLSKSLLAKVYKDKTTREYYIVINTKCPFRAAFEALVETRARIDRGLTWDGDKYRDRKWRVYYGKWYNYLDECLHDDALLSIFDWDLNTF